MVHLHRGLWRINVYLIKIKDIYMYLYTYTNVVGHYPSNDEKNRYLYW